MLWFDRGGLDSDDYAALAAHVGQRRPRVLAWAKSDEGVVVALRDQFCVRADGEWTDVAWKDIVRGGWNPSDDSLSWTLADGTAADVRLPEPGALPGLFRDRVNSSIVYTERLELDRRKGVTITARRNPADPQAELDWQVVPDKGVDLSDPRFAPLIATELDRVMAEYAIV